MDALSEAAEAVRCPECGAAPTEPCTHTTEPVETVSLYDGHRALHLIAGRTNHLPEPTSVTLQTLNGDLHVFMLMAQGEHVHRWANELGWAEATGEHTTATGDLHTSTEGTLYDVPVRISHVLTAEEASTPLERLQGAAHDALAQTDD